MKYIDLIGIEDELPDTVSPEARLIAAIINTAIDDARNCDASKNLEAFKAMQFLFTNEINWFLNLLGIEPVTFREGLLKTQNAVAMDVPNFSEEKIGRMKAIENENKRRRRFRHNYAVYIKATQSGNLTIEQFKERFATTAKMLDRRRRVQAKEDEALRIQKVIDSEIRRQNRNETKSINQFIKDIQILANETPS